MFTFWHNYWVLSENDLWLSQNFQIPKVTLGAQYEYENLKTIMANKFWQNSLILRERKMLHYKWVWRLNWCFLDDFNAI